MREPATAVTVVRCHRCDRLAGWVWVVEGQRMLQVFSKGTGRVTPRGPAWEAPIALTDERLEYFERGGKHGLLTVCEAGHSGEMLASDLRLPPFKTGARQTKTRPLPPPFWTRLRWGGAD